MRLRSSIALVFATLFTAAATVHVRADVKGEVEKFILQPKYREAHWGMLVVDPKTKETLLEINPDKLFMPASTTKLFSVAAALDALGANYRFKTPVYARGKVDEKGTLTGDLILVASGDPTLGGRTDELGRIAFQNSDHIYDGKLTPQDPLAGFNKLAKMVADSGILRVTGEVIVDNQLFDRTPVTGSGPDWLTPLIINDGLIDFTITARAAGEPATVDWRPKSSALQIDALVTTVAKATAKGVSIRTVAPGRLVVRGTIADGAEPLLQTAEIEDPASFGRSVFIEALMQVAGVPVQASPLASNPIDLLPAGGYGGMKRVAELVSPPFSEDAKLTLKVSHNVHASLMPILLAVKKGKRTLADGFKEERKFLEEAGIDVDTISFGSGAGGSFSDAVTPRAAVQLLTYMQNHKENEAFLAALPVLGVDGTLVSAVKADSPAKGKVQAKTGTYPISNALTGRNLLKSKALAGYMTAGSGRKLIVAMFVNEVQLNDTLTPAAVGRDLGSLCEIMVKGW